MTPLQQLADVVEPQPRSRHVTGEQSRLPSISRPPSSGMTRPAAAPHSAASPALRRRERQPAESQTASPTAPPRIRPSMAPVMSPGDCPTSRLNASRPSSFAAAPTSRPPRAPPAMHRAPSRCEVPATRRCQRPLRRLRSRRREPSGKGSQKHRCGAHAGFERLRRADESIDQSAKQTGKPTADRAGRADQQPRFHDADVPGPRFGGTAWSSAIRTGAMKR